MAHDDADITKNCMSIRDFSASSVCIAKATVRTDAAQLEVLFLRPESGPESASENHRPTVLLKCLQAVRFWLIFRPS